MSPAEPKLRSSALLLSTNRTGPEIYWEGKETRTGIWISAARSTAVRKTAATARTAGSGRTAGRQRGLDPRRALLLLLQRPMRERSPVRVYTTIVVSLRRVGHISKYVWGSMYLKSAYNKSSLKMNKSKFLHLIIPFSFKNWNSKFDEIFGPSRSCLKPT